MAEFIFHLQSPPSSVDVDTLAMYYSNSFTPPALAVMNEDLEESRIGAFDGTDYTLLEDVMITSGTTYTPPVGTRALLVECWGGGGGGGGVATAATNSGAAGGGGAGAYSMVWFTNAGLIGGAHTIAIGGGGNGGTAGNNTGSTGGDTTFKDNAGTNICVAKGGLGGAGDAVSTIHVGGNGGAGGPAASGTGDIKQQGAAGEPGMALAAAQAVSGKGAPGFQGGSGAVSVLAQGGGTAATGFGGGGSGGCILSGGASVAGGNGAPGLIRVRAFG